MQLYFISPWIVYYIYISIYTVRRKGLLKLKDKGCLVCHGGQPF